MKIAFFFAEDTTNAMREIFIENMYLTSIQDLHLHKPIFRLHQVREPAQVLCKHNVMLPNTYYRVKVLYTRVTADCLFRAASRYSACYSYGTFFPFQTDSGSKMHCSEVLDSIASAGLAAMSD